MSCNVVLISNGSRPHLLEQTLRTLCDNTPADQYTLTLVCDGPVLPHPWGHGPSRTALALAHPCHVIGRLKNLGAYWSEKQFGRGEWIVFIDDDLAFFPGWLERIIDTYQRTVERGIRLLLLGGVRHPFHRCNSHWTDPEWEETDAVAGYCHFMKWSTWDHFGPYDGHAKGIGQSEDFAFCRKIIDARGKVGYIYKSVMAHTGLINSAGQPILGSEAIERVPGVSYL